jgi:hypothetical protein
MKGESKKRFRQNKTKQNKRLKKSLNIQLYKTMKNEIKMTNSGIPARRQAGMPETMEKKYTKDFSPIH